MFPALIFLSWYDTAVGSIIPLIMLAVILSLHEMTDPQFEATPKLAMDGRIALVVGGNRGIGLAGKRTKSIRNTNPLSFSPGHLMPTLCSGPLTPLLFF